MTHDNYSTTGLNSASASDCDSLNDFISEANQTAFVEKIELDKHLKDVEDLEEKMNNHSCPCLWKQWSEWTDCPVSCGGGTRARAREVLQEPTNDGQECEGAKTEKEDCNTDCCRKLFIYTSSHHIVFVRPTSQASLAKMDGARSKVKVDLDSLVNCL